MFMIKLSNEETQYVLDKCRNIQDEKFGDKIQKAEDLIHNPENFTINEIRENIEILNNEKIKQN